MMLVDRAALGISRAPGRGLLLDGAFVVASDAPAAVKLEASIAKQIYGEYIQLCDGVADQTEFNAAYAVSGVVRTSQGNFVTSGTIDITGSLKDGYALIGAGGGAFTGGVWSSTAVTTITYSGSGAAIKFGNWATADRPYMQRFTG